MYGVNPAPGVKLFTASATAMQLRISRIHHLLGVPHSSGCAAETSRAERHVSSRKGSLVFVHLYRVLLYSPVVSDRCTCRLIFRSKRRAEHRHNKRDNDVVVSSVRCIHFCILMYHRPRDNLCFNYLSRTHHSTCEHSNGQPSGALSVSQDVKDRLKTSKASSPLFSGHERRSTASYTARIVAHEASPKQRFGTPFSIYDS
jgi:hypothetical protein